jgi:protein SCO1/2
MINAPPTTGKRPARMTEGSDMGDGTKGTTMTRKILPLMALAALLAGAGPAAAQLNEEAVEFTEMLGEYVPADITLIDEEGQPVDFGEFVDKPTILMMVYYTCPGICTPLLTEVADILGKSNLHPDKTPFQLAAVSFEPEDTPQVAKEKRANYLKLVGRDLPEDTWRFFTADQANIDAITGAVGFKYKRAGTEYTHPGGLIILSPDRKIVRYLYGTSFLPFDFQMGVHEATEGRVMPTTARLLQFCFSYDPEGRTYVFNLARVIAVVMITSVVFFLLFLIYTTRGRRGRKAHADVR